jgi:hypothetical protein
VSTTPRCAHAELRRDLIDQGGSSQLRHPITLSTQAQTAQAASHGRSPSGWGCRSRRSSSLSTALARWRKPNARHDPAKIVLDLAVTLALGGDSLADIALLRANATSMAWWPRTRRCPGRSTGSPQDAVAALRAINTARASGRSRHARSF